ncbi:NAD-dependent succinate-semialdehyde dehydrogenase [Pedobacter yonginense]|uniref:NAD-dependent succinate-semialdehyde dehydrogenase n=1 Tax=Pedobacter yonginense TaxID=651869 RepID=A0A317EQZ5_9SPHI|nr:aldehyde dehydrogenase family protein [Pedobacter yonginense]PWS29320.1 NAD-dependent succinate-semialdehyde dehydrogenase [Pedobacter yonginense]
MKKQYINGNWVEGIDGNVWDLQSPSTEEILAKVPFGNDKDCKLAIDAAYEAFPTWKKTTPYFRAEILKKAANFIRENVENFAIETAKETGKPMLEARGEWLVSANLFEWYAEEGKRNYGRIIPTNRADKRSSVIYQPVGVVGVITAWNFPAYNPARAVAAALAAGCTVVMRGSEFTAFSSFNMALALHQAGIPNGVYNLINSEPISSGAEMIQNPKLHKISFTGSTRVGKILMDGASKTATKLSLELGGNAPVIIENDVDVATVAKQAVVAKLRNCGQVCVAPQRFYVHTSIFNEFIAVVKEQLAQIQLGVNGNAVDFMGPLINKTQQLNTLSIINKAKEQGATLHYGGQTLEKGFFVQPTLIEAKQEQEFIQTEFFGPIFLAIPFDTQEQVLQWANQTEYGLAAYVFTNHIAKANFYAENLEFGMIGINEWAPHGTELPFSGWKHSGIGHESGSEGLKEYLELKLISYGGF